MSTKASSLEKKFENAARLRTWMSKTSLAQVPVNQFGKAARTPICKTLKIPPSTVQTNGELAALFKVLDANLEEWRKQPNRKRLPKVSLTEELQDECRALRSALAEQGTAMKLLQYLEDNGLVLRAEPISRP
ncbi:hypothetical protein VOM14_16200 [Paraburkholderia sp. MPAMCS5]|uniref:hypothetical protein n=1 Tax=Paraburkholderia sp. MPAMCS5 TaxID=3112563 RepID=UPI002E199820|nr:hypothetical protein [Paraburkholderia sp. MPAMCS5]